MSRFSASPFYPLAAIVLSIPVSACSPTITALSSRDPVTEMVSASGQPHALVLVTGTDLALGRVVWDAGASTGEQILPGGFLGAYMFSVPPNATPGTHQVAIEGVGGRRSSSMPYVVPQPGGAMPFPGPRVDHVTIIGTSFDSAGNLSATLYVQGANIDVGATVLIGGTTTETGTLVGAESLPTIAHKSLYTHWYGQTGDLGYPIHHYVSLIAVLSARSPTMPLDIRVRNLDGVLSEPAPPYHLPMDAAHVDSDGDGLLDSWETQGYDADGDGVIDVPLQTLGADPYRRDVLVQLDVMDNLLHPLSTVALDAMRATFSSAPIINPLSTNGINLILELGGKPCLVDQAGTRRCTFSTVIFDTTDAIPYLGQDGLDPFNTGVVRFSALKAKNFDNAKRDLVYHYAIWGINNYDRARGQSDFADDFLLTLDGQDASYQTTRSQAEVLVHELGHDLRQRHGGGNDLPIYKANYWSVMTRTWSLRTAQDDPWRKGKPTCLPFYYATPGADEMNGAVPPPSVINMVVDYSEGMANKIGTVSQTAPQWLCGHQWSTIDSNTSDFANWRALLYDGPSIEASPPGFGIVP